MPEIRILFALIATPLGLIFAWPLARRWLARDDWLIALLTSFGLSLGGLSLWMLTLSLLGVLSIWSAAALPIGAFIVGGVASQSGGLRDASPTTRRGALVTFQSLIPRLPSVLTNSRLPSLVGLFVSLSVISVNLLYYPFYYPDTLSRYGLFARLIFETGGLPEKVQGYPLLVSMGYAWAFLARGAVSDRLAGMVGAAFCAAAVGVTYALGREVYGRRAGLAAAFLAATSTLFVVWGTSGYVDIPTGFFFGLAALFACRWLKDGSYKNLWLAGISAGLVIWTKQAGWIIAPSLLGVVGIYLLTNGELRIRDGEGRCGPPHSQFLIRPRVSLVASLILTVSILLIAGPWYLRNYLLAGPSGILPLPGSFYEAQADHRLIALFPFATRAAEWGWPFAVFGGAGLMWGLARSISDLKLPITNYHLLLFAFILPYHLAWWWSFSYELRFLLTLLPFYAVLAGGLVDWLLSKAARPIPWPFIAAICGGLTLGGVWPRLGAVYHLVRAPFATEHDIRLRLRPDQTLITDYLLTRLSPETDSILMMDGSYEYFLTDYRTGVFYPVTLAEVQEYDYLIYPSWASDLYARLGHGESEFIRSLGDPAKFREVYRAPVDKGSVVYEIRSPD